jgi:hypothetical protein
MLGIIAWGLRPPEGTPESREAGQFWSAIGGPAPDSCTSRPAGQKNSDAPIGANLFDARSPQPILGDLDSITNQNSGLEEEIHRVLRADVEKVKYRSSDIVSAVQEAGYLEFKQHQHTVLVKAMDARNKKKPYGTFVDIHEKDWRWYRPWLDEVLRHCRKSAPQVVVKDPQDAG